MSSSSLIAEERLRENEIHRLSDCIMDVLKSESIMMSVVSKSRVELSSGMAKKILLYTIDRVERSQNSMKLNDLVT